MFEGLQQLIPDWMCPPLCSWSDVVLLEVTVFAAFALPVLWRRLEIYDQDEDARHVAWLEKHAAKGREWAQRELERLK